MKKLIQNNDVTFAPLCRMAFPTRELVAKYPPRFANLNKQAVFDVAGGMEDHRGGLHFTRWPAAPLAGVLFPGESPCAIENSPTVFDYVQVSPGDPCVHWYLNFADPDLFAFFSGGLFAQDEMQVTEHPALGSLRRALVDRGVNCLTLEGDRPTPVLITGVERRCVVSTGAKPEEGRPWGLYGNEFSLASTDAVKRATRRLNPPTISNILAISAPRPSSGLYTREQVHQVVATAYSGFLAARIESRRLAEDEGVSPDAAKTVIHTGFWGCGAFGGNRVMMPLLQFLAARAAGVPRLVFHSTGWAGPEKYEAAEKLLREQFSGADRSREEVIDEIESMRFAWGESDGN